jgi:arabinofuranosyltransferase
LIPTPAGVFRQIPILVPVLGCTAALVHALHFHHVCDDAFISFHYARNLIRGVGLVFNPGEHTMGYSDLLWVLLIALFDRLGVDPPLTGKVLGSLLAFATIFVVHRYFQRKTPAVLPGAIAVGVLAANATFALWMFGGLEGHLLGFLLTYAVVTTLTLDADDSWRAWARVGGALGLACMTRPEGILYAGPICAYMALRDGRRAFRGIAVVALITAAVMGAVTLWQWARYGSPVPNTYYAKTLPLTWPLIERGLTYTKGFVVAYYGVPVWILGAWAWFVRRGRPAPGWLPVLVIAAFVVFYLRIGGDGLVYYRMWLPTLPMFALLAGDVVLDLGPRRSQSGALVAPAIAAPLIFLQLPASLVGSDIAHLRADDNNLRDLAEVSKRLHQLPRDTLLAANIVGIPAFYSELSLVDMLGLNDETIAHAPKVMGMPAHESHDGAYVMSRKPDIIIPGYPYVRRDQPQMHEVLAGSYTSDRDLYAQPRFLTTYTLVNLPVRDAGFFPVFVRRTYPAMAELLKAFAF